MLDSAFRRKPSAIAIKNPKNLADIDMALVRAMEGIIPDGQMAYLATIASRGLTQVILGQAELENINDVLN